jgi:hypothetical protein
MYRSKKEINNIPTEIYGRTAQAVFMDIRNQIFITKQIYLLHRGNSGNLNYLYFKTIIPQKMSNWIKKYKDPSISNDYIISYLNKLFIKDCFELYEYKTDIGTLVAPIEPNVYRSEAILDNGTIIKKKYGDLLASDYGLVDVWAEQTTEIDLNVPRHKNLVRIQKSMNTRSYDRDNEGYHNSMEFSSLGNIVNGHGADISDLKKRKYEKYKRDNNI